MRYANTWFAGQLADEMVDGPLTWGAMDNDFYKFTMGLFIWKRYREVEVQFGLINRSSEPLAQVVSVDDLGRALDEYRAGYHFTVTDLAYLRGLNVYKDRMFDEDYLVALAGQELSPYNLSVVNGQFDLTFRGPWFNTSPWEVPAMAIINQLRTRSILRKLSRPRLDVVIAEGIRRLFEKIDYLKQYPLISFSDFGTRRRAAAPWQRYIDQVLAEEMPGQYLGTSNVAAARDFGQQPMGTSAHELFMIVAALLSATDEGLLGSHNLVLRDWWNLYGFGLSIALTDTFGTDFFFRDFTPEQAREWKGLRHDSGDPVAFGHKAIAFYKKHGINPLDKLLVFSDGLDHWLIVKLWQEFNTLIKTTYGWGTHLTNDLGYIKPISMVVKPQRVWVDDGVVAEAIKLSDNPAKARGSREAIERYIRVFGYVPGKMVQPEV